MAEGTETPNDDKVKSGGSLLSELTGLVSCKTPRVIQDDFVFIFRNDSLPIDNGMYRVFGLGDAHQYRQTMIDNGYKHTATLSASIWIERLLSKDSDGVVELVDSIDS